jgi:SHS2 domain-containing protein
MTPNTEGHTPGSFEYLDHAADLGIRVHAPDLPELFVTAARALMTWIGPAPEGVSEQEMKVRLEEGDAEGLLVRWLQEVLYLFHQRHAYVAGVKSIDLAGRMLEATLLCRPWDESSYENFCEVKAITYHKLQVERLDSGWRATVILDI